MASNITRDHHLWTRDTIKNVSGDVTLDLTGTLTIDTNNALGTTFETDGDKIADIKSQLNSGTFNLYYIPNNSYYLYAQTAVNGSSVIGTTTGTGAHLALSPTGDLKFFPNTNIVRIDDGDKLIFSGSNDDTYITETSNDVLDFYVGDVNMLQLNEATGVNVIKGDTRLLDVDDSTYSATNNASVQTKAQIDTAISDGKIYTAEVTITEAEMNALNTTAKVLVAAQGAGKVIIPIKVTAFVDRDASTAQSTNATLYISAAGTTFTKPWGYFKSFMRNETGDRVQTWFAQTGDNCQTDNGMDNATLTAKLTTAITSGSIDSCKMVVQYYVYDNS